MTARYVHSPNVADIIHADGEALVLIQERLLRLNTLAAEVMACCATPHPLEEIVDHCLALLGPAPDGAAEAAVEAAIRQLMETSILIKVD